MKKSKFLKHLKRKEVSSGISDHIEQKKIEFKNSNSLFPSP